MATLNDPFVRVMIGYVVFFAALIAGHMIVHIADNNGWRFWLLILLCCGGMLGGLGFSLWAQWCDLQNDDDSSNPQTFQHNAEIVQQKLLTNPTFRYTVSSRGLVMANVGVTGSKWSVGDLVEATA